MNNYTVHSGGKRKEKEESNISVFGLEVTEDGSLLRTLRSVVLYNSCSYFNLIKD